MSRETIFILHKQGADSHYNGLKYLLEKKDRSLKFREFSVAASFYKSLISLNSKKFFKQFINLAFLISLLFTTNKKIIVGIAPFDPKLRILIRLLKNHIVYYHTSWACWNQSFHPKNKNSSPAVMEAWKIFLEIKAKHLFCVTDASRSELIINYRISLNRTSLVHHALNPAFLTALSLEKKKKSFIYYGRMVAQKGIEELLYFFAQNKAATLTLIGDGDQKNLIEHYAHLHENITYIENISNKPELIKILAQHEYMVLNAKRNEKWEELFGLVIIESMSQGVIPIAAAHSGPREIISPENGILFEEGQITSILSDILKSSDYDVEMAANGIATSKQYSPQKIAEKWQEILL